MSDPLRRLGRMIHGLAARCVLRLASDGLKMQAVQVGLLDGETADGVERFQNYGFTSVPLPGAEGVCLFLGGDRAHGVVVAMDDRRYRLKGLQGGEVAIYTNEGDSIVLKRGRIIEATTETFKLTATSQVAINTPAFTLTNPSGGVAVANITGTLHASGDITAGAVSQQGHVHPENDNGGPTDPPIGGA